MTVLCCWEFQADLTRLTGRTFEFLLRFFVVYFFDFSRVEFTFGKVCYVESNLMLN